MAENLVKDQLYFFFDEQNCVTFMIRKLVHGLKCRHLFLYIHVTTVTAQNV